ncbi:MAG: hypothetical protein AVDCRST_MAG80-664 [uncultured Rubrobacteraceae bacterium]|uniref:Uncharacterized protein n=1 Tax=uncultured Rubrobacteraceae bacterium TaxID=349277 RepID=A0A6J4Q2H6_9ACTN|nr:MAG: hypothetical protein AVDCRST_MAG80-664 [uncultured Rubrobacteraceae bacterium]
MRSEPHTLTHARVGVVDTGGFDLYQYLPRSWLRRLEDVETQHLGAARLVYPYRFISFSPSWIADL